MSALSVPEPLEISNGVEVSTIPAESGASGSGAEGGSAAAESGVADCGAAESGVLAGAPPSSWSRVVVHPSAEGVSGGSGARAGVRESSCAAGLRASEPCVTKEDLTRAARPRTLTRYVSRTCQKREGAACEAVG
jgi:hypothetical protein